MGRRKRALKELREFGTRLKACRIAAGYEEAGDFANILGMEAPAYRRYERGEAWPPPDILIQISDRLDKTLDFLIAGRKATS